MEVRVNSRLRLPVSSRYVTSTVLLKYWLLYPALSRDYRQLKYILSVTKYFTTDITTMVQQLFWKRVSELNRLIQLMRLRPILPATRNYLLIHEL
jgi:hypothetical protein